jgi:hypothetical protein
VSGFYYYLRVCTAYFEFNPLGFSAYQEMQFVRSSLDSDQFSEWKYGKRCGHKEQSFKATDMKLLEVEMLHPNSQSRIERNENVCRGD